MLLPIENLGPVAAGPRTEYAAGPGELEGLVFSLSLDRMLYLGPLFSAVFTAYDPGPGDSLNSALSVFLECLSGENLGAPVALLNGVCCE